MGLVAHIDQHGHAVSIRVGGQIREAELDQIGAIVAHFHGRGCQTFVLDMTETLPLGEVAAGELATVLRCAAPHGQTCIQARHTLSPAGAAGSVSHAMSAPSTI